MHPSHWVKHACRRMKHFAALPQNMKHRRCGMKQSLFRLHVFCLEIKAKNGGSVFAHPGYAGTRRAGFDTSEAK